MKTEALKPLGEEKPTVITDPNPNPNQAPCDAASDKQLWEYDPTSREMHLSRQRSLCLDWFDSEGRC